MYTLYIQYMQFPGLCGTYVCMYTHQDVAAELEYLRELIAHGVLEVLGLHLSHLPTREIKHLLTVGGVCVCVCMC